VPIEETILESPVIDQVMVVGQDQKFLAALVVPNGEAIEKYAAQEKVSWVAREDLLANAQIITYITDEINARVNEKRGFRGFERIFRCRLIARHFEPGTELSGTLKMKRDVINTMYKKEIAELFGKCL
jgi:long-chain acyl-CoA synthetase